MEPTRLDDKCNAHEIPLENPELPACPIQEGELSIKQWVAVISWIVLLIMLIITYYTSYKESKRLNEFLEKTEYLQYTTLKNLLIDKDKEIEELKREINELKERK